MLLHIDFNNPVFPREQVLDITTMDLVDFYMAAPEADQANLFFMLLSTLYALEEMGEKEKAAHISFLAAYYLFVVATPPGSQGLARHYMGTALRLFPKEEYRQWMALIEAGN